MRRPPKRHKADESGGAAVEAAAVHRAQFVRNCLYQHKARSRLDKSNRVGDQAGGFFLGLALFAKAAELADMLRRETNMRANRHGTSRKEFDRLRHRGATLDLVVSPQVV